MNVEVRELSYGVRDRRLIEAIAMDVRSGETVGLIGPNGSGKSTLLKNIYRVLEPSAGDVLLDGKPLRGMAQKETARQMAVVSQETPVAFDFTVREMVMMGRNPHKRAFEPDTRADRAIAEDALVRVGMRADAERSFSTLSGGEKQRVLIARALAQQAQLLVLDEPTNHLDIRYQLQIMDLVKTLKLTALAALHDLNIAAYYCDRIYVLRDGRLVEGGTPEAILRPELLRAVFDVEAEVTIHPATGRPSITYLPGMAHSRRTEQERSRYD